MSIQSLVSRIPAAEMSFVLNKAKEGSVFYPLWPMSFSGDIEWVPTRQVISSFEKELKQRKSVEKRDIEIKHVTGDTDENSDLLFNVLLATYSSYGADDFLTYFRGNETAQVLLPIETRTGTSYATPGSSMDRNRTYLTYFLVDAEVLHDMLVAITSIKRRY